MSLVLNRWLTDLAEAIESTSDLSATHHRVVYPRGLPLNGSGLVRHQAVGSVDRPGQPPEHMSVMSFFVPSGREYGMQHGELARAIAAVETFILNRRIDVLQELPVSMEGQPGRLTFLPVSGVADRQLFGPMETDQPTLDRSLKEFLTLMAGLESADAEVISAALDMHHGACLLFDRDLASAYTLLIAGLEAMSRKFGSPPSDWESWEQSPTWDKFAHANDLSEAQSVALREKLMKDRQLRLNETFAAYASSQLPDQVWEGDWRQWVHELEMPIGKIIGGSWDDGVSVESLIPRDRSVLKATLRRSYQARSGFVHTGGRIGENYNEFFLMHPAPSGDSRLSFAALRIVLRALISLEMNRRSSGGEIPDLLMTLDDAPVPAASKPAWSAPRPGARPSRKKRGS